jgi:PTH1 family peptidyl-tRNA hydrolase
MKVIVGLGNPGSKYNETRHNIGFKIIDAFQSHYNISLASKKQYQALLYMGNIQFQDMSEKIILVKPQTFMNLSGKTVQAITTFFKLKTEDMIIIHDELSLPFGTVKCKRSGGHAGHNGLRDISGKIGSNYHRLRFGVNRPPAGWDTANYVLAKWTKSEKEQLPSHIDRSVDILHSWCFDGIEKTMNHYHEHEKQIKHYTIIILKKVFNTIILL